ncbi:MAG: hypothetical protein HIU82_11950 [Proteobacteria bacterium]|nr:hypothetical protein [Pseudomonadota bacterium]
MAVARATGIARSTIGRGLADLRSGAVMFSPRVHRRGGGGKPATETQPGLLAALKELVQSSIRGDPEAGVTTRAVRSCTTPQNVVETPGFADQAATMNPLAKMGIPNLAELWTVQPRMPKPM